MTPHRQTQYEQALCFCSRKARIARAFRLSINHGVIKGRLPLKLIPALTACTSKRMKTQRFSYFAGFAARELMREAKPVKLKKVGFSHFFDTLRAGKYPALFMYVLVAATATAVVAAATAVVAAAVVAAAVVKAAAENEQQYDDPPNVVTATAVVAAVVTAAATTIIAPAEDQQEDYDPPPTVISPVTHIILPPLISGA